MTKHAIAIAQLNSIVGDIKGNARRIIDAYGVASKKAAQIVLCPELALTGYPPEDLLLTPEFAKECTQLARDIAAQTGATGLAFGTAWIESGVVYNAAIFAAEGRIQHMYFKTMLPNYGVFDEKRVFSAGHTLKSFEWNGKKIALLVCEDIWFLENAQILARESAKHVLVLNASPFETGKLAQRKHVVAQFAQTAHASITYANMVGGQDDLVFDGASFTVDATGYITHECPAFEDGVFMVDEMPAGQSSELQKDIWNAMKLGLSDYVQKNSFKGVLLGLSGGIDSAITAALAVDALGADNVRGVLLPSPYTSQDSIDDAQETAKLLGIHTDTISIAPAMQTYQQTLSAQLGDDNWMEEPTLGGNLQARIRGQILMALSNKTGFMLLSTGNKSEIAVGYSTLYGDSCGGYNVLKDVYKTQVYEIAHWRNSLSKAIPDRSISKAPSAELKPDQKDADQLPPYDILDAILSLHIEGRKRADDIIAEGYDAATVKRVLPLVRINEYKRRQSCPGVKISSMMFGRDRRFPLTNRF
jgi:NAD+ synthetase